MLDNIEEYFVSKFDDLMTSFKNRDITNVNYVLNRNVSEIFPEDYAGAFFSDNNELNIFTTDKSDDEIYINFFDTTLLKIHKVEFSINDLINAQHSLLNLIKNKLVSYVSQEKNRVVVICESEKVIEQIKNCLFNNSFNLSLFEFNIGCTSSEDTSEKMCLSGDGVSNPSKEVTPWGTVGFNAYDPINKTYGIVTAGHLCENDAPYLYDYNKKIVVGSVKKKIINDNVDCLYARFSSANIWTPSRFIYNFINKTKEGTITEVQGVSSLLEGTTVRKYGIKTGVNTGKVISAYFSVDELVNHIYCSNYNDHGDSGGPIGKWDNSKMTLYGLTRRLKENNYTIACKATAVLSALGLTLY